MVNNTPKIYTEIRKLLGNQLLSIIHAFNTKLYVHQKVSDILVLTKFIQGEV